jgi:hypothetical protein
MMSELFEQISLTGADYIRNVTAVLEQIPDIFNFAQEIFPAPVA